MVFNNWEGQLPFFKDDRKAARTVIWSSAKETLNFIIFSFAAEHSLFLKNKHSVFQAHAGVFLFFYWFEAETFICLFLD